VTVASQCLVLVLVLVLGLGLLRDQTAAGKDAGLVPPRAEPVPRPDDEQPADKNLRVIQGRMKNASAEAHGGIDFMSPLADPARLSPECRQYAGSCIGTSMTREFAARTACRSISFHFVGISWPGHSPWRLVFQL